MESAATAFAVGFGDRLRYVRGSESQKTRAASLHVALSTYQHYERGERLPDAEFLAFLTAQGWNANWLLTGEGPERLDALQAAPETTSQGLSLDTLKLAVQLAQEALDGGTLEPDDYAQLVRLIYDALTHGLPSAQVIALARPAARGISGVKRDDRSVVGGSG